MQRWAALRHPRLQARVPELVDACLDHFRACGGVKVDWVATCRTWIRRTPEFERNRNGAARPTGNLERLERELLGGGGFDA